MKEGRGGGKEREAPTHFIEISVLTHAARVTKNSQTTRYYICSQKKVSPWLKGEALKLVARAIDNQALSVTVQGFENSANSRRIISSKPESPIGGPAET